MLQQDDKGQWIVEPPEEGLKEWERDGITLKPDAYHRGGKKAWLLAFSALVWTLTLKGRTRAVLATLAVVLAGALLATTAPLITTPAQAEGTGTSGQRWVRFSPKVMSRRIWPPST